MSRYKKKLAINTDFILGIGLGIYHKDGVLGICLPFVVFSFYIKEVTKWGRGGKLATT